ncbi:UNVERIFIED_CONTAM: hypothetical protein Slati_2413000 [Sesamum latifolium]|uniref:Retrotransposon protein, putative, Ty1-copia subclass n=1 Tax=Sesamum latifolium TaxID=2727402 RepID=A0AAW2WC47_9LAMI
MLVQYEATTHKSEPAVLVGEASTSKAKGKGARHWKRKKGKGTASQPLLAPEVLLLLPRRERAKGRLRVLSGRRQMMSAYIAKERGIGRGNVHNSSPTQVLERSRKLSKDEMILRLGDGKAVAAEAVGSLRLVEEPNFVGHGSVHDEFYGTAPSFWGYALETAAKLLNIAPSKSVPQTPYEIWHGKPASYKYLRVWGSHAYVKRLVGDKLDSRSSLCSVPVLRRSIRESRVPDRYGFVGLTSQLDNDPKTYGEAMSNIDSDKWLEAMKSEMDSMGSN